LPNFAAMQTAKNIIFDLGGVLLEIDFALTGKAFEDLGVHDFLSLYNQYHADTFFADFEKGKVPVEEFVNHIRRICNCPHLSSEQITGAWDALLIRFPQERVDWLLSIAKKYRIFLFSNTNIVHYQWFAAAFERQAGKAFNDCFVKAYYSHEMGLRKPDAESYQMILDEQNLIPAETIFIDDTLKNVEAAKKLGLIGVHLEKPRTVLDLGL
jgi:FMN phosphatase YigB (HAD superfamily)